MAAVSSSRTPGGSSMLSTAERESVGEERGRHQREHEDREGEEGGTRSEGHPAMLNAPAQEAQVPRHDRAIAMGRHALGLERVGGDDWGDEARDQQREEHGRGHREAELLE